jgi:two-component system invasion response regulator UvrY
MKNYLLADDHNIVRMGIKVLIADNFSPALIDEAKNGNDVTGMIKKMSYDLLLLDINMPDTDFSSLIEWVITTSPSTKILVFTAHPEKVYGLRCMQLGAYGFLTKNASNQEIIDAIRRVLENRKYVSPDLAGLLLEDRSEGRISNPFHYLSSREMEITMLIHQGKKLPEICQLLNIQYSTGNTYKRRIFEKLEVCSIVSLERLLQAHGIEG